MIHIVKRKNYKKKWLVNSCGTSSTIQLIDDDIQLINFKQVIRKNYNIDVSKFNTCELDDQNFVHFLMTTPFSKFINMTKVRNGIAGGDVLVNLWNIKNGTDLLTFDNFHRFDGN